MKKSFQSENIFYLSFIPPSKSNRVKINTRVFSKSGKRYIVPKDVSVKINRVIWELQIQNEEKNIHFSSPVEVNIIFILPNRRRRDLDNIMKTLGDCLVYADIIDDDNLIFRQTLEKVIIKGKEGVIIEVIDYNESTVETDLIQMLEKYKGYINGL